jgi:hypothetical protein
MRLSLEVSLNAPYVLSNAYQPQGKRGMTMTFNELLKRYDNGAPAERQRVLDMLPTVSGPLTRETSAMGRELWLAALRAVFEDVIVPSDLIEISEEALDAEEAPDSGEPQPPPEKTAQGWNLVLPGTERTAAQAVVARGHKIRPKVAQRDPGGMFEPQDSPTLDLFS